MKPSEQYLNDKHFKGPAEQLAAQNYASLKIAERDKELIEKLEKELRSVKRQRKPYKNVGLHDSSLHGQERAINDAINLIKDKTE